MLLWSAFFIESYYPSNPPLKQHFFTVSQLLRMLPRRGNFRPLEVPQIKMFEATLQNHFWFVVEGERILCLFQKASVSLLLFFLNKRKWPCFWKPQCYLEIHNPNEVSESKERWLGGSNELKAIQRVWELRVAFVHRNEQQNHHHQQQQQPEQLLSFGRVTFLHLHKMTMPIAGLFNLGLWMFPTWPACDTHITAFQSCQSLNIFMTLTKDTKGFKGFQHQKGYWNCWDHPETLPSLRWNALRVLCQRARRQT